MASKPLTKTSDLVNPSHLAKEFGLQNMVVQKILNEANLHAVVTMPYGKGFLRLYEPGPARDAVRTKLPKPAPSLGPIEAGAAVATLKGLGYTYHGAEQWKPPIGPKPATIVLDVLEERVETLCAEVTKLQAQNVVLLRTLEAMKGGVDVLVRQLGAEA